MQTSLRHADELQDMDRPPESTGLRGSSGTRSPVD